MFMTLHRSSGQQKVNTRHSCHHYSHSHQCYLGLGLSRGSYFILCIINICFLLPLRDITCYIADSCEYFHLHVFLSRTLV